MGGQKERGRNHAFFLVGGKKLGKTRYALRRTVGFLEGPWPSNDRQVCLVINCASSGATVSKQETVCGLDRYETAEKYAVIQLPERNGA